MGFQNAVNKTLGTAATIAEVSKISGAAEATKADLDMRKAQDVVNLQKQDIEEAQAFFNQREEIKKGAEAQKAAEDELKRVKGLGNRDEKGRFMSKEAVEKRLYEAGMNVNKIIQANDVLAAQHEATRMQRNIIQTKLKQAGVKPVMGPMVGGAK